MDACSPCECNRSHPFLISVFEVAQSWSQSSLLSLLFLLLLLLLLPDEAAPTTPLTTLNTCNTYVPTNINEMLAWQGGRGGGGGVA